MTAVLGRTLLYLDECPFNLHVKRGKKGRSVRGTPPTLSVYPKGSNVTLIGILGATGVLAHECITSEGKRRGVTAEKFISFLQRHIHRLPPKSVIILDNAKIHHADASKKFYETIFKAYEISFLFLPPYSPFLNAIEFAFSKIKAGVRGDEFTNKKELIESIERHVDAITPTEAAGFIRHVSRFVPQASYGLPFLGKPLDPQILTPPASSEGSSPSPPLLALPAPHSPQQ